MSWEYDDKQVPFESLKGKTLVEIIGAEGDDEMTFKTSAGEVFKMYHSQDCCERVSIDDIEGDPSDLIGTPIVLSEESSSDDPMPGQDMEWVDSFTWTFYRIATANGFVVIRWYGESSGYYSERVDFAQLA